jgi:hypothetical protein
MPRIVIDAAAEPAHRVQVSRNVEDPIVEASVVGFSCLEDGHDLAGDFRQSQPFLSLTLRGTSYILEV